MDRKPTVTVKLGDEVVYEARLGTQGPHTAPSIDDTRTVIAALKDALASFPE